MDERVVLYSVKTCPHCQRAKKYLDENAIKYRICDVKTPVGQKEFAQIKMRGVPVLKIGDQVLKGFASNRFQKLYQEKVQG